MSYACNSHIVSSYFDKPSKNYHSRKKGRGVFCFLTFLLINLYVTDELESNRKSAYRCYTVILYVLVCLKRLDILTSSDFYLDLEFEYNARILVIFEVFLFKVK